MNWKRRFLIVLALLLVAVPVFAQDGSASGGAQVRFVHAIPGASAIDVYTDGQLTATDLAYGSATPYIAVTPSAHHITVTQAGASTPLWEQDINPGGFSALTLVAASGSQPIFQVYQDDLNPLPLGKARFTAIHAVANADAQDVILADGRPVIPGLQYNQPYGTLDLPVSSYDLAVVGAGQAISDALVPAETYRLNSGTSYQLLTYGTPGDVQALLLAAPTRADAAAEGYTRVVHAVPGAPAVDVYLDNTLVAPNLSFGEATGFFAVPAGTQNLTVRTAGTSNDVASGSVTVTTAAYQTVLLSGSAEAPSTLVIEDQIGAVSEITSVFTLFNQSSSATASAALDDGSTLLSDVAAGQSDSALIEPSDAQIMVALGNTNPQIENAVSPAGGVYGGVYYSAVVVDTENGASIIGLPAISIAQGANSAPGAQTAALPTPIPTEAPTLAPTAAPTSVPTEAAAVPTPAPEVEILPQPTAVPTTAGPTGRILLDPGVNLQLRQYPSREAFSLGLAPAGTILLVNGREGEPVPPASQTATPLPPDATPYVDPVTLLGEGEDLDPTLTWLNVTYETPDGGSITAWVNALFIGLRNAQGRAMRLRDLPTVPRNQAGFARDTALEPPTARQNVTLALATNVDPGVRIHIRRLPSTTGESLALVLAGAQMELVGVNEAQDWVFVRYTDAQSTVTGWVSVEYVTLQRNGQAVDFERLQLLNELNVLPDDQRGSVVTSGQPTAAVAPDLRNVVAGTVGGLNEGTNLHLRRSDSEQAESLALLPNGTTLIVTGRSPDDLWLQVSYQNRIGWVFSQYVTLTFNGQAYEMATLPIIDTSTPTPTATATTQG